MFDPQPFVPHPAPMGVDVQVQTTAAPATVATTHHDAQVSAPLEKIIPKFWRPCWRTQKDRLPLSVQRNEGQWIGLWLTKNELERHICTCAPTSKTLLPVTLKVICSVKGAYWCFAVSIYLVQFMAYPLPSWNIEEHGGGCEASPVARTA